jgi:hypothetical protein
LRVPLLSRLAGSANLIQARLQGLSESARSESPRLRLWFRDLVLKKRPSSGSYRSVSSRNWRRIPTVAQRETRLQVRLPQCGRLARSLCTATSLAENAARKHACHIDCRRNALPELHRSHRPETRLYLHGIESKLKRKNTAISTMASRISIRADSLSVPKTIGMGPIITTPPPRICPVPLADLRTAKMKASIPTANPARAMSNPMTKMRLSAKTRSSFTV